MATVVTSIGSNSSIDTETPSSCSGSSSPYDVTFSTDPTGVSVGDKVVIVDEDAYYSTFVYRVTAISGSTYTLAYVTDDALNGDTSPCDLYDDLGEQATAEFMRFYSSIFDWEDDLDSYDVYESGDDAVGECHNDSVFVESVIIENGSDLNSVTLSVHPDSRHDGTAGTGARMLPTSVYHLGIVQIERADVTVEWLEISGESIATATDYGNIGVWIANPVGVTVENVYVRNNVIHDMHERYGNASVGIYVNARDDGYYILNNFVYNINRTSGSVTVSKGIYIFNLATASTYTIYNNTVFNITDGTESPALATGIEIRNSSSYPNDTTVVNNVSLSAARCYDLASGDPDDVGVLDYNLSDDTTAFGSNSVTSSDGATAANTIADTTSGSEDLHLKAGSYALDAGTDLGTTPTGVEIDIDGRDRDATGETWDIGADQLYIPLVITPSAAAFELAGVSPSVYQSVSITPAAASFEVAGVTPTISLSSATVSPTAAAFELAGVSPSVIIYIPLVITPTAAAFEVAGVSPTVLFGSVTASPAAATFELTAVSPSVGIPVLLTPAAASFELAGVTPTAVAGSLSLTPSVTAIEFAGVSPSVTQASLTVAPSASAIEFVGITPTTTAVSLSLTPAVAALELAGISPSVTRGSISITPAAAVTNYRARYGSLILGGIVVIPVQEAGFIYTAVDPAVEIASQTITVSASAFELVGVTPSVVVANIIIAPAASVVEFAASVETIHAGVEVPPAAAVFDYVVGSFTLRVEMDSASLGYACDGLNDYIGGTIPTDYSFEKNLDYRYDHQS